MSWEDFKRARERNENFTVASRVDANADVNASFNSGGRSRKEYASVKRKWSTTSTNDCKYSSSGSNCVGCRSNGMTSSKSKRGGGQLYRSILAKMEQEQHEEEKRQNEIEGTSQSSSSSGGLKRLKIRARS